MMKQKIDKKQKLIFGTNVLAISLLLFCSCCKRATEPEVRYYMYDYCEANWLLVRNAMIIKEVVINDSISCIQITNHNCKVLIEKEFHASNNEVYKYNIEVVYDKKLFQKTTNRGVYFSEDGINYVLHFDFLLAIPRKMPFQVYSFYDIKDKGIKLDTIKSYLKEVGEVIVNEKDELGYKSYYSPEQSYWDYYNYQSSEDYYFVQIVFMKGCSFPLFCNVGRGRYYVLSDATGFYSAQKYMEEAQKAIHNKYLIMFGGASNIISEPSEWIYARLNAIFEQRVQRLRKKGNSVHQIADSLDTTKDAVKRVLYE